jgi:hypothetical protein
VPRGAGVTGRGKNQQKQSTSNFRCAANLLEKCPKLELHAARQRAGSRLSGADHACLRAGRVGARPHHPILGSRTLEFAAMRNANTVFADRNNGWNEPP